MTDRRISVTLKAGTGFEAPWVVLGGDTLEEVNFQLDSIMAAGTLQKAAAVAAAFHNGYRSIKHSSAPDYEPPQETYSQPPVGSQPVGSHQGPPATQTAPQGDPWASQPPPAQDPWSGQPAAQQSPQTWGGQQNYQPQQQAQQPTGGRPPICQCGQPMEYKMAGAAKDKPVWRCASWRWNNGVPTPNHDQIWVEGNR